MKGTWKRVGAALLAVMMLLSLQINSVFASEYNSVTGDADKIQIHKKLDSNNQTIPDHTVTFSVALDSSEPAGLSVEGSIPDITMSFSDPTSELKEYIDFSKVTFKLPGNYCFKVTEKSVSLNTIRPVADSETSYYVYVHVINGDVDTSTGKTDLVVASYSAANGSDKTAKIGYDDHEGLLFENEWDNYNFYVTKKVEGVQGDKTKEFEINLHLVKEQNKPNTGGALPFTISWAAGTPTVDGTALTEQSASYESNLNGSTSRKIVLKLKDGDKVFINGLNDICKLAVTESAPEGYTVSGTIGSYESITGHNGQTITVTNRHKSGTNPPTGLFLNNWPYILVVLVAIAGILLFLRRRKARGDNEIDL